MNDILQDEIDRIEAAGGDKATLGRVRAALAKLGGYRVYLKRGRKVTAEMSRSIEAMLEARQTRPEIVLSVMLRFNVSRRTAYQITAKVINARAPRC